MDTIVNSEMVSYVFTFSDFLKSPALRSPKFPPYCVDCGKPAVTHLLITQLLRKKLAEEFFGGTYATGKKSTYLNQNISLKLPLCAKHKNDRDKGEKLLIISLVVWGIIAGISGGIYYFISEGNDFSFLGCLVSVGIVFLTLPLILGLYKLIRIRILHLDTLGFSTVVLGHPSLQGNGLEFIFRSESYARRFAEMNGLEVTCIGMNKKRTYVFVPYPRVFAYANLPVKLSWPDLCVYCCKPAIGNRELQIGRTITGSFKKKLVERYKIKAYFCSEHLILDRKYNQLMEKAWPLSVLWGIPIAILCIYLVGRYGLLDINFPQKVGLIIGVVAINHGIWAVIFRPTMRLYSRFLGDEFALFKDYFWNALGLSAQMDDQGIKLGFVNPEYAKRFIENNDWPKPFTHHKFNS
jgi:hypothetical protein